MKLDEFAFANQQLAGMLRSGIPLEGALRQICESLRDGHLREELRLLESDLAAGIPVTQALSGRRLPAFYGRMMAIGAQSQDLPALLTVLADYYQRVHLTWMRLKGLIFYPVVVLWVSFVVSMVLATVLSRFSQEMLESFGSIPGTSVSVNSLPMYLGMWTPVLLIGAMAGGIGLVLLVPTWREGLRWRLPGFRDARLANLASSLALLLKHGCPAAQAVDLVRELEASSPAHADLERWSQRIASGTTRFADVAANSQIIPPLFTWLVSASGENWAEGFQHAAEIYHERAAQRAEAMLYAVLPVSVLVLGLLIVIQLVPMANVFANLTRGLIDAAS